MNIWLKALLMFVMIWLFLVFTFALAQDDTKAPFGMAYQISKTSKYHIFKNCFILKGKEYKLVEIDSSNVCKHCINRLYAIENGK